MIETTYKTFVARIPVASKSNEFDCYAYETNDKEYYLGYHSKSIDGAYLADEPVLYEKLQIIGEKQIFIESFSMITGSKVV